MDPIRDIARYNCTCGKWIILPKSFTEEKPLICHGPCGSQLPPQWGKPQVICGRKHFWRDGKVV